MKSAVAGLRRDGIRVQMINCNSRRSQAEKYRIRSVPTFIYVENGKEVRRRTGSLSESAMRAMCRSGWF